MVRTADSALKVTAVKAPRKRQAGGGRPDSIRSPPDSAGGTGGLNPICPRETPSWQKPITSFFNHVDKPSNQGDSVQLYNKQGSSVGGSHISDDGVREETTEHTYVEAMDEELQDVSIDGTEGEDKENDAPKESEMTSGDVEMNGVNKEAQKRVNVREEESDEEMLPKKKFKLDKDSCAKLLVFEKLL